MKLNNIELSGFKTFVDPTSLLLKGQLVGIVGPNGCGKSNIIDAVRWVMGEGSAKALRGDSMADVIFNGSSSRQPIGLASVKLGFDNSDGSLGGEYASYSEISIKREVTRDGQSNYYLNGTRCRRKDIVDIFLGTGLGPRSYSIIEQGMISRVIESKADALRDFFEEAAGTSIYKRRRHDTELRMRHTIDNLNQLEYLMQEQNKQLDKLKKQSVDARKFKEYQQERALLDAQVAVLKYQDYETYLQSDNSIIRNLSLELEQMLATKANLEADLEKIRLNYAEQNEQVNSIQAIYYNLGTEIARKEQILQHKRERHSELNQELLNTDSMYASLEAELVEDNAQAVRAKAQLNEIEPDYTEAKLQLEAANNILEEAELKFQDWNERWELYQHAAQDVHKQTEVAKEKITQLEKQARDFQVRADRLDEEQATLHPEQKQQIVAELQTQSAVLETQKNELAAEINLIINEIKTKRTALISLQQAADAFKLDLQQLAGKHSSLTTLQEAALVKNNAMLVEWLEQNGGVASASASLIFVNKTNQALHLAENLAAAQKLLAQLSPADSILTADGVWLAPNWLRIQREDNPEYGVVARQQEITELQIQQQNLQTELEAAVFNIEQVHGQLEELEQEQKDKSQLLRKLELDHRTISNDLSANTASLNHILARIDKITAEKQEQQQNLAVNCLETKETRMLLAGGIEKMAAFIEQKEILETEKEQITTALKDIQYRVHQARDRLHELDIARSTVITQQQSISTSMARLNKQINDLLTRKNSLIEQLDKLSSPEDNLTEELDQALEERLTVENELSLARASLELIDTQMKNKEKERTVLEKQAEATRTQLDEYRINRQTYAVKKEAIVEYMQQNAIDLTITVQNMPADLKIDVVTAELERVNKRITNLGAINLAAIEEYDAEVERKEYMDSQYKDLADALHTLESAIAKIDQETKVKFKQTFDQVNTTFKALFPKLFGGGEAYLELTEGDLLSAGVTVMARPPGKKNSSIHLLSGGEKALTAVALVFSIFQLNPAPFCMLDEVDAPLDDANVGRFCNMLREMADKVQFIFITHNKITMEIAHQLAGVTMKEPGVSRLVSVDIAQAVEMVVS